MPEAIIITPVKDSLETTKLTVSAVSKTEGNFEYFVFNDFSQPSTKLFLDDAKSRYNFTLINLDEITNEPSPNYKLVLETAQKTALEKKCHLIIVESDVVVKPDTLPQLLKIMEAKKSAGMIGAITVDKNGNYNFPYTFEKEKDNKTVNTSHSLSFCCTLISHDFLNSFDFKNLSENKDWFDIFISRQSKKMGYHNYLAKGVEVLHLPHSSRPWKNLKYKNPVLYYIKKIFNKRDRI